MPLCAAVVGSDPSGHLPTGEQLEAAGLKLCSQPVLSLFGDHVSPAQASCMLQGADRCRDFGITGGCCWGGGRGGGMGISRYVPSRGRWLVNPSAIEQGIGAE